MTGDNSTLARVLSEGGGRGTTNDHRRFADRVVVDGKWRILALLGNGGNGEVYRVQNVKTGLLGALKVPNSDDAHSHSRFDRELDVLQESATWQSSTASRHLPHFVDRGTIGEDNVPYFVIEFLHPLKFPTRSSAVRKVILEVCEAVGELHKNGYLHRDIKPGNLMRRDNGDVVLIDFGLVARIDEIDNLFARRNSMTQGRLAGVGTDGFVAPEQLLGYPSVRSDVYSLGALANYFFGGKLPGKWISIIQKAQNPNPEYRFSSVKEFAAEVMHRVPGKWNRSICGLILITLSMLGVSLCVHLTQRQKHSDQYGKQNKETWEEFVERRVQEDRSAIEQSMKDIRTTIENIKRDTEERKKGLEATQGYNKRIRSNRENKPRIFSKLKFIEALQKRKLWEPIRAWLAETGQYDLFQAAQNLKEDYPAFVEISKAAKERFGISEGEFNKILSESVDDQ